MTNTLTKALGACKRLASKGALKRSTTGVGYTDPRFAKQMTGIDLAKLSFRRGEVPALFGEGSV